MIKYAYMDIYCPDTIQTLLQVIQNTVSYRKRWHLLPLYYLKTVVSNTKYYF